MGGSYRICESRELRIAVERDEDKGGGNIARKKQAPTNKEVQLKWQSIGGSGARGGGHRDQQRPGPASVPNWRGEACRSLDRSIAAGGEKARKSGPARRRQAGRLAGGGRREVTQAPRSAERVAGRDGGRKHGRW